MHPGLFRTLQRIGRPVIAVALAAASASLMLPPSSHDQRVSEYQPHQVKAAAIYNFLLFTSWPDGTSEDGALVVGVLGADDIERAFGPVKNEGIGGRPLETRRLRKKTPASELYECHVIFLSTSAASDHARLLSLLDDRAVLTISDSEGFLDKGGMINLVTQGNKIKFEVNTAAADRAGIKFRAKLLRLAVRIVREDDGDG